MDKVKLKKDIKLTTTTTRTPTNSLPIVGKNLKFTPFWVIVMVYNYI